MLIVILRDWQNLFSGVDMNKFDETEKEKLKSTSKMILKRVSIGIKMLPYSSRGGVF